jgi:hypothetical protein
MSYRWFLFLPTTPGSPGGFLISRFFDLLLSNKLIVIPAPHPHITYHNGLIKKNILKLHT